MGQITVPDMSDLEDEGHERAVQRQLDDEAEQRARDKLTHVRAPEPTPDLDPARGVIFGALCGLVFITWAGFTLWRALL